MITYTRNLIAVILAINLCACQQKSRQSNEVIYKNYSLQQLKTHLDGIWTTVGDTSHREFVFKFKSKPEFKSNSNDIGYIDYLEIKDLHATFFQINKDTAGYNMTFISLHSSPDDNTWGIRKISNLELVLSKNKMNWVMKKVSENKVYPRVRKLDM